MSRTVAVAVPCDVVPVRVLTGYGRQLSPMEQVVLTAVAGRARDLDELVDLFGTGQPIMLDLVLDLWHSGYVVVDPSDGTIQATSEIRRLVADKALSKLAPAETDLQVRPLMIDKLSGFVLPRTGSRRPVGLPVPVEGSDERMERAANADLIAALNVTFIREREGNPGRPLKALVAHLAPTALGQPTERRWLPLDLRVGLNRDTGRLQITVVDDVLPLDRRRLASQRLEELAENMKGSQFVNRLLASVDPEYVDPPSLEECLDELEHEAKRAALTSPGLRSGHHHDLEAAARRAVGQLEARVAAEVKTEVVAHRDGHRLALDRILKLAKTQIVLVAPRIGYDALSPHLPILRAAMEKGVQVVVLWGRGHDDAMEDKPRNALTDLRRRGERGADPRLIWTPYQPGRTNATAAIADDRMALVSGTNFLAGRRSSNAAVGVLVSAPAAERSCAPIEALLEWTYDALPDYRTKQGMVVRRSHFARDQASRAGDARESAPGQLIELPSMPAAPPAEDGDELAQRTVAAWSDHWVHYATELRRVAETRRLAAARLVQDGGHRDLLWAALRRASRRLVIGSTAVRPGVIAPIIEPLRDRLSHSVSVTIISGTASAGGDGDRTPFEALERLHAATPGRTLVIDRRPSEARVLIADDTAVVGSFDYLAMESSEGIAGWRLRSELSLQLTGQTIADEIAIALGTSPVTAVEPDERLAVAAPDVVGSVRDLLEAVRNAGRMSRRYAIVRELLADQGEPWAVLDELQRRVPPQDVELVRVAVADSLGRLGADSADAQRWLAWLLDDRWSAGAFLEAAVLRAALIDRRLRPRSGLAMAAATRGTVDFGAKIAPAVDEALADRSVPAAAALVAVAASEVVAGSDGERDGGMNVQPHLDALEELRRLFPEPTPWTDLVDLAWTHWSGDVPSLRMTVAELTRRRGLVTWTDLAAVLESARVMSFPFGQGTKTHAYLFHSRGTFGRLASVVETMDDARLTSWLAEEPVGDLAALVDRATDVATQRREHLHTTHRNRFLRSLSAVVVTARSLDRASAGTGGVSDWPDWLDRGVSAARDVRRVIQSVRPAVGALERPEEVLARAAIDELDAIAKRADP